MFDGIVHQIDNDLNDQPGIAPGKEQFIFVMYGNGMLRLLSAAVLLSLRDDLFYQMRLFLKPHPTFFDLCNRQQILH